MAPTASSNHGRLGTIASASDVRLAELYATHINSAVRLAALLTGDPDAARDIAHEAFCRLGARLFTLRQPDRAAGYLFRTVANLAKDHGRSLARERRLRQRLAPPLGAQPQELLGRGTVWQALLSLPARQRTVLFLRHYLDMSESDAADVMQLSVSAVKSLTHRATKACREYLEESPDDRVS